MGAETIRACPGCRGRESRPFGVVDDFSLAECDTCGTVFTALIPSQDEGHDYARYYGPSNLEVPSFIGARLDEVVASFEPYRRLNRWLDVGFGAGTLLHAAARNGWQAAGVEVAQSAIDQMRSEGFEVHRGELEQLDLPPGSFDVLSFVEVVEHVPAFDDLLRAAIRLLRPEGALYITTPNARGISARLLGSSWSVVSPPEHLQLFSVRGLSSALLRAGAAPRRVRTHAVNPRELAARFRRDRAGHPPPDRVQTGYALNQALTSRPIGRVAKRSANAVLSGLRLGDTIKVVAERRA